MTDRQELNCPNCGARIYWTDAQCVSCGVRLDERQPVREPRREAVPAAARSETQYEQRARPSRWPVYLAVVPIGFVAITALLLGLREASYISETKGDLLFDPDSRTMSVSAPSPNMLVFYVSVGAFGVVTAYGLLRLRRWGWWCAIVWAGIFTAGAAWACRAGLRIVLDPTRVEAEMGPMSPGFAFAYGVTVIFIFAVGLFTSALLTWVLVTRRRLFF